MPGPIPKRSDERIRRNVDDVPIEKITEIGEVDVPDLGFTNPHPIIKDLYDSLKESAQSRYFEPSDWQFARMTMFLLNKELRKKGANGQILSTLMSNLSNLLVSEGDRRRMRLEIERKATSSDGSSNVVDAAAMFIDNAFSG